MDILYLWPDKPALSLFVLWLVSSVFLWAAREPMLQLLKGIGKSLEDGFGKLAERCGLASESVRERNRASLLAAGLLETQSKLDREFQRVDSGFSEQVERYAGLHRRLDDLLNHAQADYRECGNAPPEVPGWTSAVESIASIPSNGDPNVHKILEGIRTSLRDAEKRALSAYRVDTAKRHKVLGGMLRHWKELRNLMSRMHESVAQALEKTMRISTFADDYERIRTDQERAARTLTYSAVKLFCVSLIVLTIAFGGAFINFQLIALPMSELVPAGARIGGVPVSSVSALVIVLMETALGFFVMDMLGITDLFPKLAHVPAARRRLILSLALGGLLFLACVESSLAILREQIVEADAALKLALADAASPVIQRASTSQIPLIGQAVLGFILPWILALTAVPLEMLLDSGRHVAASGAAVTLAGLGHISRAFAHASRAGASASVSLYDVYISVPLRIERGVRSRSVEEAPPSRAQRKLEVANRERALSSGEVRT
ncbi:MAG: hypothetical protein OEM49_00715 [Myxococcales bacterium]|nr:hypothetical protein [Myxococcales bacterium]MDH5306358.1 hypothetical protein [Myxococcales bacterium]MDH5566999.1 hypothetical protein [Myxococcales bacterium]